MGRPGEGHLSLNKKLMINKRLDEKRHIEHNKSCALWGKHVRVRQDKVMCFFRLLVLNTTFDVKKLSCYWEQVVDEIRDLHFSNLLGKADI